MSMASFHDYPMIFYMNYRETQTWVFDYPESDYTVGWYYHCSPNSMPVGPFGSEGEAVTELNAYCSKFGFNG